MYCSECGVLAAGKFCANCGTPLQQPGPVPPADCDWRESCDYALVTTTTEVRRRIEEAKAAAGTRVSSSQLLGLIDAAAAPLMYGLSSVAIAKVVQPLYGKLGVKTGKERRELVPLPPGVVLANIAVALAPVEHTITSITPSDHRCTLKATLPADLRSMESHLTLTIERTGGVEKSNGGTWITAAAMIEGQLWDWGKCQSRLDGLFAQVRAAA